MKFFLLFAIRFYQRVLSPLKPASCRFYPSCSEYAKQSIEQWGIFRGMLRGILRLLRCHPWNPGGIDPVQHQKS